ncbi:transcriptional repressor [Bacillus licheniformis]|nr:transcriptional repressor [Bacillus licheniformis]
MGGHPSAEDIHRELPYMSLPTIYSNLKLFVKLGILKELSHGDAKANMNCLHHSIIMSFVNHAGRSLIWTILTSRGRACGSTIDEL